ncbi:MAG: hypothetical protein GF309_16000 [Candidatus Lokiarchaeota archaeon]|nr:hypothetical protein [Candidatus Lokiarchaeota archaeon]
MMAQEEKSRKVPYSKPGPTEKRIRNVHVFVGLALIIGQFVILSFEDWLLKSGLSLPTFIIIIGFVYGSFPSAKSDHEFLEHVIQPRTGEIPEKHIELFLRFRKMLRAGTLLAAYGFATVLFAIWLWLANAGANVLLALPFIALAFALFIPALGNVVARLLAHVKYKEIQHLFDIEREILRKRRGEWY